MQTPPIQFSHSNGFPAKSYNYFFQQLSPFPVSYVPVFGLGQNRIKRNWRPLAEELIKHIETYQKEPVIGLGHSLGGVLTLFAALDRPDLFRQIILMDPPLFDRRRRFFMGIAQALGLAGRIVPVARMAKRRRDHFLSKEEAFEYWKPKGLFREFHPQCFQDYVEYGLKPDPNRGGFTLTIPSQVEYELFLHTPSRIGTIDLKVPCHYIYATRGAFDHERIIADHKRIFHNTTFLPFEGRHMFPLEQPESVGEFIRSLIKGSNPKHL